VRDDCSSRTPLDKDPEDRIPRSLWRETRVTLAAVRVYAAIRSRAGFEPAAENFLIAWPGEKTIGKDAGVSTASVIRSVNLLDSLDYLIVERGAGPNGCNRYGVIIHRERFMDVAARYGRAEAIYDFHRSRAQAGAKSRKTQAKGAERNARQYGDSGQKLQPCNQPGEGVAPVQPGGLHGCEIGGVTDATRSVDQGNCGSGIRGAAGAAPVRDQALKIAGEGDRRDPYPFRTELQKIATNARRKP
jgi:hypothetical protein